MHVRGSRLSTIAAILAATVLAACDARRDLWQSKVGEDSRAFFSMIPCHRVNEPADRANPPPLTYYELVRWDFGAYDRRRGVFGAPVSEEGSAYAFTYIDERGRQATQKAFLIGRSDAAGRHLTNMPSNYKRPDTGTCAGMTTIPWSKDRNRPFWVGDATLAADPAAMRQKSEGAGLALFGLVVLFAAITGIVGAGYFDEPDQRGRGLGLCAAVAVVSLIVLWQIQSYALSQPLERLVAVQDYYRTYDRLPKSGGHLLPLDIRELRPLLNGPPLTTGLEQTPQTFWTSLAVAAAIFFLVSVKRFVMGLYWLFVPLPLEVSFRRARNRGEWPKAQELIDAIRRGTVGKTTWQARAMTLKAEMFAQELARLRDQLRK